MKEEYDSSLLNLKHKNEILTKEKKEQKIFFEKKIENLNAENEQIKKELSKLQNEISLLTTHKEDLQNELNDKIIEIKEIGIEYEKQIISIRQNFEESLDNFQTNFRIQSGETDPFDPDHQIGKFK